MREIKFRAFDKEGKYMFNPQIKATKKGGYGEEFDINTELKKFELMQYTGLKDKNGKEIYEGDIIRSNETEWYQSDGKQYSEIIVEDIAELPTQRGDWSINIGDYEVIGNIYENPELIK